MPLIGSIFELLSPVIIYDALDIFVVDTARSTTYRLFENPVDINKGQNRTNLYESHKLPDGQKAILGGFEIEFKNSPSEHDLKEFLWKSLFQFVLNKKAYISCPVADLLFDWQRRLPKNIEIQNEDEFSAEITLTRDCDIRGIIECRALMHVHLLRPVQ